MPTGNFARVLDAEPELRAAFEAGRLRFTEDGLLEVVYPLSATNIAPEISQAVIAGGAATMALLEIKAALMAFLDTDRDPPRDLLREYLRKTAEALNLAIERQIAEEFEPEADSEEL